ncbi:hypothetical protein [Nocardia thraciensis]
MDVERLARTTADPAAAGSSSLEDISAILERSRRLEDTAGAALVLPVARGIDGLARALAANQVADSADLADDTTDRSHYAHVLSFRAYSLREQGRLSDAMDLTTAALEVTGVHPSVRAYDMYQLAKFVAASGDSGRALRLLHKADRATEGLDGIDQPSWAYWYNPAFFALQRGRVLWIAGAKEQGRAEVLAALAAMPEADRESTWAVRWRAVSEGADIPG